MQAPTSATAPPVAEAALGPHTQALASTAAPSQDAKASDLQTSSPATEPGLPVEFNRDGRAVNCVDKAGVPGLGHGLDTAVPSGIDSDTVDCQTSRKPGLQTAPKAPLAVPAAAKCLDHAGATSSSGGQCVSASVQNQAPTSAAAPAPVDSTTSKKRIIGKTHETVVIEPKQIAIGPK